MENLREEQGVDLAFADLRNLLLVESVPETNLVIIIASVEAAKSPPLFSHRQRPGYRDQNRCFHPPFNDREGQIASAILETLAITKPEALIDIHNTSGSGPSFAVTISH